MLIIRVDLSKPAVLVETTWWTVIVVALLVSVLAVLWLTRMRQRIYRMIGRTKTLEVEVSDRPKLKYTIDCSEENIEVAHRILIELVTRKAAIEIDPSRDVIKEVYDSWYTLFSTIRNELKAIPGRYLRHGNDMTYNLVDLTLQILNHVLRPHLTSFQADFRHWYEQAIGDQNLKGKSPQDIQAEYPRYRELVEDMLRVNRALMSYADQLRKLISAGS